MKENASSYNNIIKIHTITQRGAEGLKYVKWEEYISYVNPFFTHLFITIKLKV